MTPFELIIDFLTTTAAVMAVGWAMVYVPAFFIRGLMQIYGRIRGVPPWTERAE